MFKKLVKAIGREDLLEVEKYKENHLRKANEETLNPEIEKWTLQYNTDEVVKILDAASVPVGPILGIDELLEDPQIKARDMLVDITHPILGKVKYPGNPIKFSETSDLSFESAPLLGEHNDYVLKDVLKMSEEKISELKEKDIF